MTAAAPLADSMTAAGTNALTASAEAYAGLEYSTLDYGTMEITKYDGIDTEIAIPSEIDGIKVTSIGESAFEGCIYLESVTIPDGVTSIGNDAFTCCGSLETVYIPASVTSIGKGAFDGCYVLACVYYAGTEEQWNKIAIADENECLTNVSIHFGSAVTGDTDKPEEPAESEAPTESEAKPASPSTGAEGIAAAAGIAALAAGAVIVSKNRK